MRAFSHYEIPKGEVSVVKRGDGKDSKGVGYVRIEVTGWLGNRVVIDVPGCRKLKLRG
jgi:hypothetical protein